MDFITQLADDLAKDALEAEVALDDDRLVDQLSNTLKASSMTLQEAFMTSVRIRRSEIAGRKWLARRIAKAQAESAASAGE